MAKVSSKQLRLVGYLRYVDDPYDAGRQLGAIQSYCAEKGYRLVKAFEDAGKPSAALERALTALNEADGLIAIDIERFVGPVADPLSAFMPIVDKVNDFGNKLLIVLKEGIYESSVRTCF